MRDKILKVRDTNDHYIRIKLSTVAYYKESINADCTILHLTNGSILKIRFNPDDFDEFMINSGYGISIVE